ncbi:MAG: hypothetical protein WA824_10120 [Candidatus Sulfotelmatobacter sp.]
MMTSMDLMTFCPNLVPFSIFPFDDRMCIDLAIGSKSYATYLNLSQVLREFEANGWTVERSLDDAIAQTRGELPKVAGRKVANEPGLPKYGYCLYPSPTLCPNPLTPSHDDLDPQLPRPRFIRGPAMHQPTRWHEWGEEAFGVARETGVAPDEE